MKTLKQGTMLLIAFFLGTSIPYAQSGTKILQTEKHKNKAIGISIPIIWNNSEATYYRLGSPQYPSGKAVSYGVKIDYTAPLYKNLYGRLGTGYFRQCFNIIRPFDYYYNPSQLLYSTESYFYDCIQAYAGLGYRKLIKPKTVLNAFLEYNYFKSFSQRYTVSKAYSNWQINKNNLSLGNMICIDWGFERLISSKFSLGTNLIIPIYTHWNKDETFANNNYSPEELKKIARAKFSLGVSISCHYNF